MSDVQLTPDEIRGITGKVQPAAQIRHLRRMGIPADRSDNPDRPVCVLRARLAERPMIDRAAGLIRFEPTKTEDSSGLGVDIPITKEPMP